MANEMKRIRFGDREFDSATGELLGAGDPVKLQPQPARVLELLLAKAGEVVTREEIRAALWPDGTTVEFDQGLNYCIRQIRAALGESASEPMFIETLPKKGYRFVAPVEAAIPARHESRVASNAPFRRRVAAVAAAVVVLGAGGWIVKGRLLPGATGAPKSIIVRPFTTLGEDPKQTWLADALSQRLIGELAKNKEIHVLP